MAGYIRQDVSNNIANGNVIDADDFDNEFDSIAGAFNTSTGHTHDGSSAEGAPITVVGPAQDVIVSATAITPKTDDAYDLGSASNEWKDLYVDGTANIDNLVADAGTVAGAAVTTISNTQTLTNKTLDLTDNTLVVTSAQLAAALTDETGTGSAVFSNAPALTSPTMSGVPTAPTAAAGTNTTQVATTAHVFAERTNTATLTNKTLTSPIITGGTASGIALTGIPTAPTATTGTNTTQVATTAFVQTEIAAGASDPFPSGGIIMWSGAIVDIPSGWLLCNGTSGTPDLRGRMIIGAGGAYAVGDTGGNTTITLSEAQLPSHTHTFSATTSSDGSHNHTGSTSAAGAHTHSATTDEPGGVGATTAAFRFQNSNPGINGSRNVNGVGDHTHSFTTSTATAHTHTVSGTTSATGSGSAINILNPYYALAYIMKS